MNLDGMSGNFGGVYKWAIKGREYSKHNQNCPAAYRKKQLGSPERSTNLQSGGPEQHQSRSYHDPQQYAGL